MKVALRTYPLDNYDYSADDAALFHCTRTTGIYAEDDFTFSVSGADNTIKLGPGISWMRLNRFRGVVAAMKEEANVDMGLPDPAQPRIDRVVIQFDANKNGTEVVIKKGTPSSNPVAPARMTTEALFEIHLLEVRREPGAVAIRAKDVTDLRLSEAHCGLMADSVTRVDTSAINAQATALIQELRREIDAVKANTAFLMKSGGTMSGPLNMSGNKVSGLPTPTENGDAVPLGYVNDRVKRWKATIGTNWSEYNGMYYQYVDVPGLLSTDHPFIDVDLEETDTMDEAWPILDAWNCVFDAYAGDGNIEVDSSEPISCEIPILLEVHR